MNMLNLYGFLVIIFPLCTSLNMEEENLYNQIKAHQENSRILNARLHETILTIEEAEAILENNENYKHGVTLDIIAKLYAVIDAKTYVPTERAPQVEFSFINLILFHRYKRKFIPLERSYHCSSQITDLPPHNCSRNHQPTNDQLLCDDPAVSKRSLSIWTTMICGYAQNRCANEALVLFDGMVVDNVEPNGATLASVLSACAQSGCLDYGEKVHVFMEERGVEVGVILGTALVNMYAKNGAILLAWKCFDGMLEKNIATWNAMICGLAAHGYAKEAVSLFGELKKEGVVPNDITFVGVLSACCHAGLLDFGREMFELMSKVYAIEARIEHYGCLVNLLGRAGKLKEAEEVIRRMRWKADVMIWGALLSACRNHGNIEIAERVVKEILVLDPHNHGVYVVLSNMYAEVGQWTDVSRLRKVMKKESLTKTPGLSLISGDD